MKSLEIVNLSDVIDCPTLNSGKTFEFVESFFQEYKDLANAYKVRGKIISIIEEGDIWPSYKEYGSMDHKVRNSFATKLRNKMRGVMEAIDRLASYPLKCRYTPVYNYIGDGKVILWWKFKRKKKFKNEATG